MNTIRRGIAVLGVAAIALLAASPALATPGSHSGPSASISWDDTSWYLPTGCSQYPIQYTVTAASLILRVTFLSAYGDDLGSASLGSSYGQGASGTVTFQVCSFEVPQDSGADFPITIQLDDSQSSLYGDGSSNVFQAQAGLG